MTASTFLADNPFTSDPTAIPGVTNLQTIVGYTAWIATALCLIGLIITGATMAVSYQRGGGEGAGRLGAVVAGCLIVGGASSIVGAVLGFNLFTDDPTAVPGLSGLQTVIGYTAWVAAAACLIGLIIAGGTLAVQYSRGGDHTGRLGSVVAGCLVVGGASSIVGALI